MTELLATGAVRKMKTALDDPVSYTLILSGQEIPLNQYLGRQLQLQFHGVINCIHCNRKTNKSFNQGYCYPCFTRLAQCDSCIVSPEKCHFAAGTCREPEWGEQHCMIDHIVYLANTSGIKVGITRTSQVPTRWMDQGATQARPIFRVASRLHSGLVEATFKAHIADKTNWQAMLKADAEPVDFEDVRRRLMDDCAAELDAHFVGSPLATNAPVLLALLSIWYVNFWGAQSHAVLPYARKLDLLPDYLQQLEMESNGKRIDREGAVVKYATAPVIFGNVGANSQHSFHQMFHQGTHLVPSDFIVTMPGDDARGRMLAGSAMAQTAALMRGDRNQPDALPGNQPSTTILMPQVDARTLGALLSLYEHKVFVEGVLWNINSFDQPGVELGKRIATHLAPALAGGAVPDDADASTRALAARLAGK